MAPQGKELAPAGAGAFPAPAEGPDVVNPGAEAPAAPNHPPTAGEWWRGLPKGIQRTVAGVTAAACATAVIVPAVWAYNRYGKAPNNPGYHEVGHEAALAGLYEQGAIAEHGLYIDFSSPISEDMGEENREAIRFGVTERLRAAAGGMVDGEIGDYSEKLGDVYFRFVDTDNPDFNDAPRTARCGDDDPLFLEDDLAADIPRINLNVSGEIPANGKFSADQAIDMISALIMKDLGLDGEGEEADPTEPFSEEAAAAVASATESGTEQPADTTSGGTNPPKPPATTGAGATASQSSTAPVKPAVTTTQKPTTTEKPPAKPAEYPQSMKMTEVNYIIPQGIGIFENTIAYDRFNDAPSFAITNNQGKELIVRLRPADKNNPKKSYADIYTDRNGDGTWEWQRAMECPVSSDESLGEYEGWTQILLDNNYSTNYGNSTGPHAMKIIDIYWAKEWNGGKGGAKIRGGAVKSIPYSEYQRLQNAGSGVQIVRGVDGTNAAYYK